VTGAADECWSWTGAVDASGYGQIRRDGKVVGAHRVAMELFGEAVPNGYVVDHLCRNPSCVNPAHLECVTMAENTRRGLRHDVQRAVAAGTHFCQRGHPMPQVTRLLNSCGGRYCIPCQRDAAARWRRENREHINEMQRARRAAA
jgi:hypothetical protein